MTINIQFNEDFGNYKPDASSRSKFHEVCRHANLSEVTPATYDDFLASAQELGYDVETVD